MVAAAVVMVVVGRGNVSPTNDEHVELPEEGGPWRKE